MVDEQYIGVVAVHGVVVVGVVVVLVVACVSCCRESTPPY